MDGYGQRSKLGKRRNRTRENDLRAIGPGRKAWNFGWVSAWWITPATASLICGLNFCTKYMDTGAHLRHAKGRSIDRTVGNFEVAKNDLVDDFRTTGDIDGMAGPIVNGDSRGNSGSRLRVRSLYPESHDPGF